MRLGQCLCHVLAARRDEATGRARPQGLKQLVRADDSHVLHSCLCIGGVSSLILARTIITFIGRFPSVRVDSLSQATNERSPGDGPLSRGGGGQG